MLITANKEWNNAAKLIDTKIELESFLLQEDFTVVDTDLFKTLFGIGDNGAILIRPDGYIAWKTEESTANLNESLSEVIKKTSFSN